VQASTKVEYNAQFLYSEISDSDISSNTILGFPTTAIPTSISILVSVYQVNLGPDSQTI